MALGSLKSCFGGKARRGEGKHRGAGEHLESGGDLGTVLRSWPKAEGKGFEQRIRGLPLPSQNATDSVV